MMFSQDSLALEPHTHGDSNQREILIKNLRCKHLAFFAAKAVACDVTVECNWFKLQSGSTRAHTDGIFLSCFVVIVVVCTMGKIDLSCSFNLSLSSFTSLLSLPLRYGLLAVLQMIAAAAVVVVVVLAHSHTHIYLSHSWSLWGKLMPYIRPNCQLNYKLTVACATVVL
jgi:hypothetical protein